MRNDQYFGKLLDSDSHDGDFFNERSLFLPPNLPAAPAFGRGAREKIWERAKNKCELTGWSHVPREAAHLNHERTENYNSPSNGLLVADILHLAHHVMFKGRAAEIGLTEDGNDWAINQICNRVIEWRLKRGIWQLGYEIGAMHKAVNDVMPLWENFYVGKES